MNRTAVLALAALAVAGPATPGARAETPGDGAEAAFQEARTYTVRVRAQIETPFMEDERGAFTGAGFLVDAERGWIVTNAHVVGHSPSEVQVAFWGEPFRRARKIYVDPFADVAVLATAPVPGRRAAALDPEARPRVGEPVGAFGHPLDVPFTGTRGIVSGFTDQFGPSLLQIDATIDHGNSGGPVIALRERRIVGIATAGLSDAKARRLNLATPIRDVCRILELLRAGDSPSPPRMGFSLLRDEDHRHTLRVARSSDPSRWPFEPGDRILGPAGGADTLRNLSELVNLLRGWTEPVRLLVERRGQRAQVTVRPSLRPLVVERRGVVLDGALISVFDFADLGESPENLRLVVHSVESGSAAQGLGVEAGDMLHMVDQRPFQDLESLVAYLGRRPRGKPIHLVLRRVSPDVDRFYDYHSRELPGTELKQVGPAPPAG
jgi:serine protease Do